MLTRVEGVFYRSVAEGFRDEVMAGSVAAGRYSPPGQRTLYMSASAAGARLAVEPYVKSGDPPRAMLTLQVEAEGVFDLRDDAACRLAGVRRDDALAPWREAVAAGVTPPSWTVVRTLKDIGAVGLIDPSRRGPGLWHLALFAWNAPGLPTVRVIP